MDEKSLTHWGILGMKWGKRRFRNYDGTLTQLGKERYDYNDKYAVNPIKDDKKKNKISNKELNALAKNSTNVASSLESISKSLKTEGKKEKMDLSEMSNYDLEKRIHREQLERDYNKLFADYANPKVEAGKKIASLILDGGAKALAIGGGTLGIIVGIKQLKGG